MQDLLISEGTKVKKRAFTLIELLIVMAIVAILAAIAIPQYNKYKANAMYSKLESNLERARVWAENVVINYDKFPNGTCDASSYSGSGFIKCSYDSFSKTIKIVNNGNLYIDIPLKAVFFVNASDESCGIIEIECPFNNCNGLKNHNNNGNAKLCINSCDAINRIREDTNLHGLINGGCP